MTIWNVDIMWAMMLFGITLFLGCFIVSNRAMRGMSRFMWRRKTR